MKAWIHAVQRRPAIGVCFSVAVLGVAFLALNASPIETLRLSLIAFLAGWVGFAATVLGALPIFFIDRISTRMQSLLLSFASGVMLAASIFSLLVPSLESARELLPNDSVVALVLVVIGLFLGVLLMLGLDYFTPHEHEGMGPCGPGHELCRRVWLFVFAVTLHNLPEGMAIGMSWSGTQEGWALTTAIAIQDLPEGLAVGLALLPLTDARWKALVWVAVGGLMEPLGALFGSLLIGSWELGLPIGLALSAGAMLFVILHEVVPETHQPGKQLSSTLSLLLGFVLMMILDTLM